MSVDRVQGNQQGMDPYAYVGGNPETLSDPTGERVAGCIPGRDGGGSDGTPMPTGEPGGATDVGNCQENPGACGNSQPPPHPRPKLVKPPASGCNKKCGDDDRQFIMDYLKKMRDRAINIAALIGDLIALVGDFISAILNLLVQNWVGFWSEFSSTLVRSVVVMADFGRLGGWMPTWLADALTGLRWAATIVDILQGALGWLNPLGGVVNLFGQTIKKALLQKVGAIAQWAASVFSIGGTTFLPNEMNAFYWDQQINAVSAYSDQQAHDICVQDYGPAGLCQ